MFSKTGIDIISTRIGKLEKECLLEILKRKEKQRIIDLGSGSSYFGLICTFLNNKVFLFDKKMSFRVRIVKIIFSLKNIFLYKKDLSQIGYNDFEKNIDFVYSSRFLHYLNYSQAEKLIKIIYKNINKNGFVFFSSSGLSSVLSEGYEDKNKEISERFCYLTPENQKKFKINQKVCLYTESDLVDLFSSKFDIKNSWTSDFGNVFLIAQKK